MSGVAVLQDCLGRAHAALQVCESACRVTAPLKSRCLGVRVPSPTQQEVCVGCLDYLNPYVKNIEFSRIPGLPLFKYVQSILLPFSSASAYNKPYTTL